MQPIVNFIDRVLSHAENAQEITAVRTEVRQMMSALPLYAW
jgi:glycine/serine hydroxymethyltransferase